MKQGTPSPSNPVYRWHCDCTEKQGDHAAWTWRKHYCKECDTEYPLQNSLPTLHEVLEKDEQERKETIRAAVSAHHAQVVAAVEPAMRQASSVLGNAALGKASDVECEMAETALDLAADALAALAPTGGTDSE